MQSLNWQHSEQESRVELQRKDRYQYRFLDKMGFSTWNIIALGLYIECFAGIAVNLIIVAANMMKRRTLKSLPTCDKILSCLMISRSLSVFNIFLAHLFLKFYGLIMQNFVVTAILLTNAIILHYTDLWFAAVLCVYYCVKITTYNWKFFTFMKTKISTLVPWFLLASLVISISSGLPFSFYLYDLKPQNVSNSSMELFVFQAGAQEDFHSHFFVVLVGSSPPFTIFLVADGLLLHSLWTHTRRMRGSGSGIRSPNLESHVSAVKSMSLFLVLQITYFTFMNVFCSGSFYDYWLWHLASLAISCSLPFFHSLYIMCFCPEIKKAIISMCHGLTRCQKSHQ
ncbi:taste receptor type 2 member 40-like [Leptodactylus fuscus]|uniref:taste receptor type 2 member 40-like n=1 Tax=Leptodactylus fuscus TaxID=238119 RepID=UPI003F4EF992